MRSLSTGPGLPYHMVERFQKQASRERAEGKLYCLYNLASVTQCHICHLILGEAVPTFHPGSRKRDTDVLPWLYTSIDRWGKSRSHYKKSKWDRKCIYRQASLENRICHVVLLRHLLNEQPCHAYKGFGDVDNVHSWWGEQRLLLASSSWRPGILLNIL